MLSTIPPRYTASSIVAVTLVMAGLATTTSAVAQSNMVTRKAWNAKSAVTTRMRRHRISGLMIHHTGLRQKPSVSLERKMRSLQRFSQKTGKVGKKSKPAWGDVPYHFYIGVSGRIAVGRSLKFAGDTNTRYKPAGWIQIVVEGDFTVDQPTPAQIVSLQRLSNRLRSQFSIPTSRIASHRSRAITNCPGRNLEKHLALLHWGPPKTSWNTARSRRR